MASSLRKAASRVGQTSNVFGVDISKGLGGVINQAKQRILNPSAARAENANLPKGAQRKVLTPNIAQFSDQDWRVRLSLSPASGDILYKDPSNYLMTPVRESGGVIFPYTPMIMLSSSATYSAVSPSHSNYAQFFYGNSMTQELTVTGDFTAQNQGEARYLLAVLVFLRTATKMFWGTDSNPAAGTPPPVLRLNGYGPNVFPNIPVVISNFTYELPTDIDYIATNTQVMGDADAFGDDEPSDYFGEAIDRVPTQVAVSVSLAPLYSRSQMNDFSLDRFNKGEYAKSRDDSEGGFI